MKLLQKFSNDGEIEGLTNNKHIFKKGGGSIPLPFLKKIKKC